MIEIDFINKKYLNLKKCSIQIIIIFRLTSENSQKTLSPQLTIFHCRFKFPRSQDPSHALECQEKLYWCGICNQSGRHSTDYCYKNPQRKISLSEKAKLPQEHANAILISDLPEDHPIRVKQREYVNWVKPSHSTSTQTHFTFNLTDNRTLVALADSGATTSMIPLSEVNRLQLQIDTSVKSTLIGANNLPITTMGATHLPIVIKGQQKNILAYIAPNPKAPTILGLNFLHQFKFTLAFDGNKSYLTDALAEYDFEKECCVAVTARQQAVSSNINYLVTEQISEENQFQGKPSPIIIPEDEDLRFDPLSLDDQREQYFTEQWYLDAEQQFQQLSGPAKFDPIDIHLLPDAILKKQRFYPLNREKYKAAQELVQDYLNRDILRHSYSPYSSPVLIVPKPGGRWRFVSDFRELNAITKLDAYPLPLISGVMARVSRGKVYALIDLKDGFYQLQISPQASEYCAVTLPFGLYEFTRLVMGWTNAPANFQRKINKMLAWGINNNIIEDDTVEAYIDDLLVYAEDMPSLFTHVNNLIQLLLHFNMAIIPTKCHFGVTSAKYLGFILIPGGKTLSQQITNRIKEKLHNIWLESQDETDEAKIVTFTQRIIRIIGTLVYFQQFIPRFTVKARFLFNKLKEKTPFTSDDKQKLQKIIDELAEHHTIYSPDASKETEVFTDASNYHMG